MDLLSPQYADLLARVEDRLARGRPPREAFEGVDDDLFAVLSARAYDGYPAIKAALPDVPSEELVSALVGARGLDEAMREAGQFWRLVKTAYAEHGRRPLGEATLVDYGAGWGRIARLAARDVQRLYAVEPNAVLQQAFRDNRVPGELVAADFSSGHHLPVRDADLLISFAVLTHTSELLSRNIRNRWAEMVAPGGVVVFTVRPESFLDAERGEITQRKAEEIAAGRDAYQAGRPAFWPYAETPYFGITVMPMAFLHELFDRDFEIVGPWPLEANPNQLPIVMVRR